MIRRLLLFIDFAAIATVGQLNNYGVTWNRRDASFPLPAGFMGHLKCFQVLRFREAGRAAPKPRVVNCQVPAGCSAVKPRTAIRFSSMDNACGHDWPQRNPLPANLCRAIASIVQNKRIRGANSPVILPVAKKVQFTSVSRVRETTYPTQWCRFAGRRRHTNPWLTEPSISR